MCALATTLAAKGTSCAGCPPGRAWSPQTGHDASRATRGPGRNSLCALPRSARRGRAPLPIADHRRPIAGIEQPVRRQEWQDAERRLQRGGLAPSFPDGPSTPRDDSSGGAGTCAPGEDNRTAALGPARTAAFSPTSHFPHRVSQSRCSDGGRSDSPEKTYGSSAQRAVRQRAKPVKTERAQSLSAAAFGSLGGGAGEVSFWCFSHTDASPAPRSSLRRSTGTPKTPTC